MWITSFHRTNNFFKRFIYDFPLNISSLTQLKLLQICLEIRTFPADISYWWIQLWELQLSSSKLKYLPRSFTARGAFSALIMLNLSCFHLDKFPEVEERALPKLQTLDVTGCESLKLLLESIALLTSLTTMIRGDSELYRSTKGCPVTSQCTETIGGIVQRHRGITFL
jgi:hypothetical protein